MDEVRTKVLRVFLLAYSQTHLQLCLEISILSNSCNLLQFLLYTVKEKEGKPKKRPNPLPYGLSLRTLKIKYAQKPQWHCTFMNSAWAYTVFYIVSASLYYDILRFAPNFQVYTNYFLLLLILPFQIWGLLFKIENVQIQWKLINYF